LHAENILVNDIPDAGEKLLKIKYKKEIEDHKGSVKVTKNLTQIYMCIFNAIYNCSTHFLK
jgi:hypothetical protein